MAETTTISNLPQITIDELTNDTLVPVENVDGTKAANLAQLRKKLNSLYVEMVDVDLNELKQDGIYECWGTTLNAPTSEVAAWIIQTAEHEGVVVQNAFGLGTTSYSYVYRRRWNGVSWTAWENRILSLEDRVQALETRGADSDLAAVGRIETCGYNDPLPGTLLCNGGAYSRTTYSRLFSKIGTTWGAGDGNTTFNVPNLLFMNGLTDNHSYFLTGENDLTYVRFNEISLANEGYRMIAWNFDTNGKPFLVSHRTNEKIAGYDETTALTTSVVLSVKTIGKPAYCIRY